MALNDGHGLDWNVGGQGSVDRPDPSVSGFQSGNLGPAAPMGVQGGNTALTRGHPNPGEVARPYDGKPLQKGERKETDENGTIMRIGQKPKPTPITPQKSESNPTETVQDTEAAEPISAEPLKISEPIKGGYQYKNEADSIMKGSDYNYRAPKAGVGQYYRDPDDPDQTDEAIAKHLKARDAARARVKQLQGN